MERYPGLSWRTLNVITGAPITGRQRDFAMGKRGDSVTITEAETGVMHFEDGKGSTSPGMQVATRNWKGKLTESPSEFPEGNSPAHILTIAQ